MMSPTQLLERDNPIFAWHEGLLDMPGGIARRALGCPA
jgi:hypothetical protein